MSSIEIVEGDITKLDVDAIVNAANNSLLGGGGVDGAIHSVAGPELLEDCRNLNGCETGEAKITDGYNLPAKYIIHTVGPVWKGGNNKEDELLAECYKNCFRLTEEYGIKTIAFPAISTGVYRFPVDGATQIAVQETKKYLKEHPNLEKVIFVCFNDEVYSSYKNYL